MTCANTVESPCVDVCVLDEVRGYCTGCYRTIEEIGSWLLYTPEQRAKILAMLGQRRTAFNQARER